jgi:hypothetical protein
MKKKVQNGYVCGVFAVLFALAFTACSVPEADKPDPALTGTVSISGTAQIGQTLTVNTAKSNHKLQGAHQINNKNGFLNDSFVFYQRFSAKPEVSLSGFS